MWECVNCQEVHEESIDICWKCGTTCDGQQPIKFLEPVQKKPEAGKISRQKLSFQTEYSFILPKGYVDGKGNLHREGTMRLAQSADEILPLKDPRVQENPAYLVIILFSRVITKLGNLPSVNATVIEGLFASDLAYLQDFYNQINGKGTTVIKAVCPQCKKEFQVEP